MAQVRRDSKTEKNAPDQTIDHYSGEFNNYRSVLSVRKLV